MESYRHKPLEGLLKLNKEDYKSVSLLNMLDKVEEDVISSPKGRAKRLMLFFYLIDILKTNKIDFYVKGGLILQYYLKDHARPANDIDLLIPPDVDEYYQKAKQAFENNNYGLDIKIIRFNKREADENYYFPTFNMTVSISMEGEEIDTISLEGMNSDLFQKVSPKEYQGPSIIRDDFSFLGVSLEYIFAEKLLAVTSELERPYKHLIDAYSISQLEVDINEVKKYLTIILDYENITRAKLGIPINEYKYKIRADKKFNHNYYFPMIQAGFAVNLEEIIQKLNQYMATNLN